MDDKSSVLQQLAYKSKVPGAGLCLRPAHRSEKPPRNHGRNQGSDDFGGVALSQKANTSKPSSWAKYFPALPRKVNFRRLRSLVFTTEVVKNEQADRRG
jgi:hypothetical protein